ncbi:Carcinine transporter [Nymphon striatum]|nr:Carcinine transporter [Nymphon striatum]
MCKTMICTCRRYGLKCVAACGKCRGEICENAETTATETVNEDDIDNDGNIFDILDEIIPLVITGALSLTGGLCTLLLPETLHQPLPETIPEAEEFGKKMTWADYTRCIPLNPANTHPKDGTKDGTKDEIDTDAKTAHERSRYLDVTLQMADITDEDGKSQKHCDVRPSQIRKSEAATVKVIDAINSFMNPFDVESHQLFRIASGAPAPPGICEDIMDAETKGKHAKNSFITERLVHFTNSLKKDKDFFEPIKRLKL